MQTYEGSEFQRKDAESSFKSMKKRELRAYIDGCHKAKEYDSLFELACRVYNSRFDNYAFFDADEQRPVEK